MQKRLFSRLFTTMPSVYALIGHSLPAGVTEDRKACSEESLMFQKGSGSLQVARICLIQLNQTSMTGLIPAS